MPDQLRFLCNGPSTLSLTLTLTFYLGQNCDLGEGRYSVTQKPQLIKRMRNLWESPGSLGYFQISSVLPLLLGQSKTTTFGPRLGEIR